MFFFLSLSIMQIVHVSQSSRDASSFICIFPRRRQVLDILEGFQCCNWSKLTEELWSLYSSSCASGSISPYAEPEYDQEARYEFVGHEADSSQASKSQLYATSELRSSAGLSDMCIVFLCSICVCSKHICIF